jgi:hypothetical protein
MSQGTPQKASKAKVDTPKAATPKVATPKAKAPVAEAPASKKKSKAADVVADFPDVPNAAVAAPEGPVGGASSWQNLKAVLAAENRPSIDTIRANTPKSRTCAWISNLYFQFQLNSGTYTLEPGERLVFSTYRRNSLIFLDVWRYLFGGW